MNKFFNRALFYRECKVGIQLMVMPIGIFLYEFVWKFHLLIARMSLLQKDKLTEYFYQGKYLPESDYVKIFVYDYFFKSLTSRGVSILYYILAFGIFVFCFERIAGDSSDLYALPFRKLTIISTRWITTIIIFSISIILTLIIMLIMCGAYGRVISGYISYMVVCKFLFIYFLTGIYVISVAMLGQNISKSWAIGGFISIVLLYFGRILLFAIMLFSVLSSRFDKFGHMYLVVDESILLNPIFRYLSISNFVTDFEGKLIIRSIILIILTITICISVTFLYSNSQILRKGSSIINKGSEQVAKVFISGFIILLSTVVAIMYINPKSNNGKYIAIVFGIILGISIIKILKERIWDRLL